MQATLSKLEEKYKNNPYMLKKLHDHITENLEPLLDSIEQNFNSRQERKNDMTDTLTEFSNHFLKNKNLYYCNHRELFFNYENDHYVIYNEDDIIHDILKLIHRDSKLFSWKFKVKNTLIKQIKDRNVYNSIPESNTIQSIIKELFPLLFPSKNWAKYFLTVIGDLLLKKEIQQNLIYFFTYENKDFIKQIAIICNNCCGINLHNHFKFKYHDHAYENCRLISCNKINNSLLDLFKKNAMDFLCVATHYSNRYINSEHFLAILRDKKLKLHALYLKENNVNDITNDFLKTSMITNDNSKISFKNVVFVWKKYLQLKHLPNIIFHQNLISQLNFKFEVVIVSIGSGQTIDFSNVLTPSQLLNDYSNNIVDFSNFKKHIPDQEYVDKIYLNNLNTEEINRPVITLTEKMKYIKRMLTNWGIASDYQPSETENKYVAMYSIYI